MNRGTRAGSILILALLAACSPVTEGDRPDRPPHTLIPAPVSFEVTAVDSLVISGSVPIVVDSGDAEAERIGRMLAAVIGNSVESTPSVIEVTEWAGVPAIRLTRSRNADLGPEGYTLTSDASGVAIVAETGAGLFYGVQTLRQLLPWYVEYQGTQEQPLTVPYVSIVDSPRYEWRGTMLDVARHFFQPDDLKRLIDLAALYKMNRLHLHLSDDQGWRIQIPGWPDLTDIGGTTEVGGGAGGFYTTEEYADLVQYAAERFMTVVPEIDLPGHTNAALASYPGLNCGDEAPPLYTGIAVGFSTVCVDREITYSFINDVVREISANTPGAYFHLGGDEVEKLSEQQYAAFMERAYDIVASHGKTVVAWDEVTSTRLPPGTLVQLWRPFWDALDNPGDGSTEDDSARTEFAEAQGVRVGAALEAGARLILSPADRIYLDMKYDDDTFLGLRWAGLNDVRDAYEIGASAWLNALPDGAIAGVEAPIWSETVATMSDVEFMAFPRLPGVAEFGWSPDTERGWSNYRLRLAAHGERWTAMGVNFNRSPLVPW